MDHTRSLRNSVLALISVLVIAAMAWADPALALSQLTIDDARIKEGDSGTQTLTLKVHLAPASGLPTTVEYTTIDGTATVADGDYDEVTGTIEFAPGAVVQTIYVTFHGDTKLEGNEWFRVRLSAPDGASIADAEAIATLVNDEGTTFHRINADPTPYFAGTLPSGWGDCNGDGIPDLPLYWVQPYGGMVEIPGFRDLLASGNYHGVAWCDFDRDGDVDLAMLGYTGIDGGTPTPTRLLRNDQAAGFVDVAPFSDMNIVASGETAVWADFDADGWPDLFAPYYSHIYPFQSFLYRNNGDGTFTDRAADAGVSLPNLPVGLRPEGAQAADWNDDGYVDLYCASHLFQNDGTGHFADVRAAVGLPVLFDEGAAIVDIDSDGDFDLYVRSLNGPQLFRNDAGHFVEVTAEAGLGPLPLLWGDSWADVEGDGDLDLLLQSGDGTAILMLNDGTGVFERDTTFDALGVLADLSAWADIDGDGDVDCVLGAGAYRRLYRNLAQQVPGHMGSHLAVRVLDGDGHRTAYGATVRLRTLNGHSGSTQTRVVDGGSGYLGQNDYDVHFGGLGSGTFALEVVYPSPAGTHAVVDSLVNPALGRLQPAAMVEDMITVRRDGHIEFTGHQSVAGIPSIPTAQDRQDRLGPPTPNPARSSMTIPLRVAGAGRVTLAIHDLAGRLVRRFDRAFGAGATDLVWDLRDERGAGVPSGVYLARLDVDGRIADTRRLLVIR